MLYAIQRVDAVAHGPLEVDAIVLRLINLFITVCSFQYSGVFCYTFDSLSWPVLLVCCLCVFPGVVCFSLLFDLLCY